MNTGIENRVAFTSLDKGQSYVHVPGGKVRTVYGKSAEGYIVVIRHDGPDRKEWWFTRIYSDMISWNSMVILVPTPILAVTKNTEQIQLFL